MRRIVNAVRSSVARIPPDVLPDLMLVVGFVIVAFGIRDGDPVLLWLGGVPFLAGLAVNVDTYRRARK